MKTSYKMIMITSFMAFSTLASAVQFQDFNQDWSLHENTSGDCREVLSVKHERSQLNYDDIITIDQISKPGHFDHDVINASRRVVNERQEVGEIQGGRLILTRHRKQILSRKYSVQEKKFELDMNLPYLIFKSYEGERLKRSCIYMADNAELIKPVQNCELLLNDRPVSHSDCTLTANSSGQVSCMLNASVQTQESRDNTVYDISYYDITVQGEKRELYNRNTEFKVSFKYQKTNPADKGFARPKELNMAVNYPVGQDREVVLNVNADAGSKLVLRCE